MGECRTACGLIASACTVLLLIISCSSIVNHLYYEPSDKHIAVIGSGFSGLASACYLRQRGYQVTVFEKNSRPGGRANVLETEGFKFDMGPSWYWMPDVFDSFFGDFNYEPKYNLHRLDPSYAMYWDKHGDNLTLLADDIEERKKVFEAMEPGSGAKVDQFLEESRWKYEVGMGQYVQRPGHSFFEMWDVPFRAPSLFLELIYTQRDYVAKFLNHPRLKILLEWPVLFLGASPQGIPQLYSLMNWAEWGLGTHYPLPGGMYAIVEAMYEVATGMGVNFAFDSEIHKLNIDRQGLITSVETSDSVITVDGVINSADYHWVEQNLLPPEYRRYSESMWDNQVFSPACYLYYLGFDMMLPGVEHHTFFFHEGLEQQYDEIYTTHEWPEDPVFYVNAPSKIDSDTAPEGHEAVMVLIPVSPNLHTQDNQETRDHYLEHVLNRMESVLDIELHSHLVLNVSFAHNDFKDTYHGYKGNAFGLANTLFQTWMLKPKMQSLINNLIFVGQLTAPGPGVPPSLISGRMGATMIHENLSNPSNIIFTSILLGPFTILIYLFFKRAYTHRSDIERCYEVCRQLHMSHGLSYYVSTLLLPEHQRKYVFALYGLTRTADEIVDDMTRTEEEMTKELNAFRSDFFHSLKTGEPAKHPVNRAAVDTAQQLNLHPDLFRRFFASMEMDIKNPLYFKTMDELLTYMDGSAAVIGEFMLPVLVGTDFYIHPENYADHRQLILTARALGNAFQLTNFCRDVAEDVDRGRVYLPLDVLEENKVSLESVKAKKMTPKFGKVIEQCLLLCDKWYEEGDSGIELLAKYSDIVASCIGASHKLYSGISSVIRANGNDVFKKRCRVSMNEKLGVLRPHLKLGMVPDICEMLLHHTYLRITGSKPNTPPPVVV